MKAVGEYGSMVVLHNPQALPRFFLAPRTAPAANAEEALARMKAPGFEPGEEAVVEGFGAAAGGRGTVRVARYGSREVVLETNADAAAMLVSSEAWYPGWRAWVDGREAPLAIVNAAFRGLPVPAGKHTVAMRFEPAILWRSGLVSAAALGALILGVALGRAGARWSSSSN
jgi:hypothetical protein